MALSQAAKKVDEAMGGLSNTGTQQVPTSHVSNPAHDERFHAGETMQALTWEGKNTVKISDTKKPILVDDSDAVIKITGTTVCGSDMHLLHGAIVELGKGDILGHEFMGEVESIGPGVKNVQVGDRVVCSFQIACGQEECWACKRKLSSVCPRTNTSKLQTAMYGNNTALMAGYSHFTGGIAGGQAEYARVPWADANLLKLPADVSDEDGLYLSDILCTSYHQVVDSNVQKDDIVGVWGAGAIGICAAKWSFIMGASRVIVIDNVQERLDFIKTKIPKVEVINFNEVKDIPGKLNEMTGPGTSPNDPSSTRPAGLDVALDCAAGEYAKSFLHKAEIALGLETDTSEIANEMIMAVRPFGTVGLTGVYAALTNHFNIGALMEKGVRFIGNGQAPIHLRWKEVLKYIQSGEMKPTELFLTHRIPLEDVPACYKAMDNKTHGLVKAFVETKFSKPPSAGAPQLTRL